MDDFRSPQSPQHGDSPYSSPGQAGPPNFGPGAPDAMLSTAPRTFGILNIVFGSILLLGGLCCGVQVMGQAMMGPAMAQQQQRMKQQMRQRGQAAPPMPDFTKMNMMADPRVSIYSAVDVISGIILNLIMVVSGIGLLSYKEWARKLAVGIAAIKVLRLLVLETYCMLVVAPVISNSMAEMVADMMKQMPQPGQGPMPGAADIATIYNIMIIVTSAAMLVLGVIYPLIMFFALRRPAARAACGGAPAPAQFAQYG